MRKENVFNVTIPFILINNENVMDPKIVTNAFNTFFLTYWKHKIHQAGREYTLSSLKDAFPGGFSSINIIQTTQTEIESIKHSLISKNSWAYDEITSEVLKCSSLICCLLIHICNHLIQTDISPTVQKLQ